MQADLEKFLSMLNEEYFTNMFKEYNVDLEDFADTYENLISNYRDKIYKDKFSFLDKYIDVPEFFESIDYDSVAQVLFLLKIVIPDELYFKFMDAYYRNKDLSAEQGLIFDLADLNHFLDFGFSIENIVSNFEIFESVQIYIYQNYPEFGKAIIEKSSYPSAMIIAASIVNGEYGYLKKYFDRYGDFDNLLENLLIQLLKYDSFDFATFFDEITTKYSNSNDLSVLNDENLIQKLIDIGGSKAIVFSKNLNEELVRKSNFSFSEYSLYDGSYKNSSALLMKFLNEGKADALMYANSEAINDEVINYIRDNNISLDRLKSFDRILDSFPLVKYFIENNDYSLVLNLTKFTTDLDCFEYMYNLFVSGAYSFTSEYYNSNQIDLLCGIFNKDWSGFSSYRSFDVALPVASRMIEVGLTVDEFVNYLKSFNNKDVFIEAFAIKDLYLPLLFAYSDKLIDKYLDKITYELYTEALNKVENISLSRSILYKFVKEGHYEVLKNEVLYLTSSDLEGLGFDKLTYEEYLELPDYVRNLNILKERFLEYDSSYLMDLLGKNPSVKILERAALSGMSFDEILPFLDKRSSNLNSFTVLHYLKQGDVRALDYFSHNWDNSYIDQIIDLYYSLLNGAMPSESILNNYYLTSGLVKKFLADGKFEILEMVKNFSNISLDDLLQAGYNFELFKKFPILNYEVISYFATLENEKDIVRILIEQHEKDRYLHIYNFYELFLDFYRKGFNKENLMELSKKFNIDSSSLLKSITDDDYGIFDCMDLSSMLNNKLFLSKILGTIDVEKARELISNSFYSSSDTKILIIRKMVERGYYDFISYYTDKVEEEIVKRALMGGYFPEKQIFDNRFFRIFLNKIKFTPEELDYLKSKIDTDVRYIFFFPEIINDNDLLLFYIKKNPIIIKLIDFERRKDINLLKIVVKDDPKLCSELIYSGVDPSTLATLILENKELLQYLDSRYLNIEVIEKIIPVYPNILDFYSGYCNGTLLLKAIDAGYVFSELTSSDIVEVALLNGFSVDQKLIKAFGLKSVLKLSYRLIKEVDSPLYNLFKNLLNEFKNEDSLNFLYEFILFVKSNWIYGDALNEFISSFGIDISKYNYCNFDDKESFVLSVKLLELPRDNSAALLIDDIVSSTSKIAYLVEWLSNNLSDFEKVKEKYNALAKKHFLEDPLFYSKYVNPNDPDIIKDAKGLLDKYPSLYKNIPAVLDNKELILQIIEKTEGKVYSYLSNEFRNDLDILKAALKYDDNYFSYVDFDNPIIMQFARDNLFKYPIVCIYVPGLIDSKETALELIKYKNGYLYYIFSEEFRNDYDICSALLDLDVNRIYSISNTVSGYKKLVIKALEIDGSLFTNLSRMVELDEEIIVAALKTFPAALFMVSDEYFTEDLFKHVSDITKVDSKIMTLSKVLKMIHFSTFNTENVNNCEFVVDFILGNIDYSIPLDKNDLTLRKIFAKAFSSTSNNIENNDGVFFRKVVSALPYLDIGIFGNYLQIILKDTLVILGSTGKLNTLDKNPVFNYDVVKYIYPLFGVDFVKDIIKYNTPAASVVINEIKNNNKNLMVDYYNIICEYNIFNDDDKRVHFAFRNFDDVKSLITNIINLGIELTAEDIVNLRKIIVGRNIYGISSYSELKEYDEKTQEFWTQKLNTDDISEIKNILATLFGYANVNLLSVDFNNFQLNNFMNLKTLRSDIILQYGKERAEEIFAECFYNKKDISIITLMERVINSDNINELKELMSKLIKEKNGALDYCDEVREVIRKTRLLHNYQFNGRLTKIDDIKSTRMEKDNPSNPYGVTIIEMDSEKFNFLAHRLYSYDGNMGGFKEMLIKDPSLWTKLEGASTLSTSSISDKGFWCIDNMDNSGVVYLFNNLPKNFMLFMNGRDLYVEHGGYKIEPTASKNAFTNIDALNQCSCYAHGNYNEVAGFREGMLPCAFACFGDVPNEATIRAAKYFSESLGVDVPIIKFNVRAYDNKKVEDYKKAKEEFNNRPNYQAMYNIFFDGIKNRDSSQTIHDKVDYCLNILNSKYQNKDITFEELNRLLLEMESLVSQIIVDLPNCKKELSRIGIFRKTLSILKRQTLEEIIRLEGAQLGESGIMFKFNEGEDTYLIKPSVDKKGFATQSFRADVQEAASRLQEFLSPATSVRVESIGGKMKLSKQELVDISPDKATVLEDWVKNGGQLDYQYSSALLREYVIDFLLCNFDCYVGNFIIDSSNNVRGIDKEQSFRFIDDPNSLKADFSFTPNGVHRIPIYQYLFNRYKAGEIDLDLSVITDTIEKVNLLTDDEYKAIFRDYAVGLDKYRVEEILDLILRRRDDAIVNMNEFVEELLEMKNTEGVTL